MRSKVLIRGLLVCAGLAVAAPVSAATFGEVLDATDGNPGHNPPCLEVVSDPVVPSERPFGRCATNTVGALYLALLRDRERLAILRAAITRQQALLQRVQHGAGEEPGAGDLLLAELELNRWQVQEAEVLRGILHAELFFASVMEAEPSEMVRPHLDSSRWPASRDVALAALAQQEKIPQEELPAVEIALQHAWIDYEATRHQLALLQQMSAFAGDLAKTAQDRFAGGKLGLAGLHERLRDDAMLQDTMVNAEYRLLVIQYSILELMGRRSAIE